MWASTLLCPHDSFRSKLFRKSRGKLREGEALKIFLRTKIFIDKEMDAIFANAINTIGESRFYSAAQHRREFIKSAWGTAHCGGMCRLCPSAWDPALLLPVNLLCSLWRKNLSIGIYGKVKLCNSSHSSIYVSLLI